MDVPLVSHGDDHNVDGDILACSRWRSRSESNVYWIIEIFLVLIYKCALSLTISMLTSRLFAEWVRSKVHPGRTS